MPTRPRRPRMRSRGRQPCSLSSTNSLLRNINFLEIMFSTAKRFWPAALGTPQPAQQHSLVIPSDRADPLLPAGSASSIPSRATLLPSGRQHADLIRAQWSSVLAWIHDHGFDWVLQQELHVDHSARHEVEEKDDYEPTMSPPPEEERVFTPSRTTGVAANVAFSPISRRRNRSSSTGGNAPRSPNPGENNHRRRRILTTFRALDSEDNLYGKAYPTLPETPIAATLESVLALLLVDLEDLAVARVSSSSQHTWGMEGGTSTEATLQRMHQSSACMDAAIELGIFASLASLAKENIPVGATPAVLSFYTRFLARAHRTEAAAYLAHAAISGPILATLSTAHATLESLTAPAPTSFKPSTTIKVEAGLQQRESLERAIVDLAASLCVHVARTPRLADVVLRLSNDNVNNDFATVAATTVIPDWLDVAFAWSTRGGPDGERARSVVLAVSEAARERGGGSGSGSRRGSSSEMSRTDSPSLVSAERAAQLVAPLTRRSRRLSLHSHPEPNSENTATSTKSPSSAVEPGTRAEYFQFMNRLFWGLPRSAADTLVVALGRALVEASNLEQLQQLPSPPVSPTAAKDGTTLHQPSRQHGGSNNGAGDVATAAAAMLLEPECHPSLRAMLVRHVSEQLLMQSPPPEDGAANSLSPYATTSPRTIAALLSLANMVAAGDARIVIGTGAPANGRACGLDDPVRVAALCTRLIKPGIRGVAARYHPDMVMLSTARTWAERAHDAAGMAADEVLAVVAELDAAIGEASRQRGLAAASSIAGEPAITTVSLHDLERGWHAVLMPVGSPPTSPLSPDARAGVADHVLALATVWRSVIVAADDRVVDALVFPPPCPSSSTSSSETSLNEDCITGGGVLDQATLARVPFGDTRVAQEWMLEMAAAIWIRHARRRASWIPESGSSFPLNLLDPDQ
ncbi:hypothetical protein BC828DRAFT_165542 [Blastocladiella britannica]|nr:hypothetical protein BC828DRAFT_165542 [Blastocladiella britannica]